MRIDVYSHHFAVTVTGPDVGALLRQFALYYAERLFTPYGEPPVYGQFFATRTRDRREYRFHINTLPDFRRHVERAGFDFDAIELTEHAVPKGAVVEFPYHRKYDPTEQQVPLIKYLAEPGKIKVLTLQTGKGKTFCTLQAMLTLKLRTAIVIKPMYIQRWLNEFTKDSAMPLESGREILVIRGTKSLINLIQLAHHGMLTDVKVIIFSNKTLYRFIDHYRTFNGNCAMYGCKPYELFGVLGVGLRVIDEVHQDFHFNVLLDLFTQIEKTIDLSATLTSNKHIIRMMYEVKYPKSVRIETGPYHKYISVKAVMFSLKQPTALKWNERGRRTYSHNAFERSILSHPASLKRYIELTDKVLDYSYLHNWIQGFKCIVFASTVKFCTAYADHLKSKHSHLKVNRYTEEDSYDVLETSDVIVSTLQSAGTAVDISKLRTVIMTTAVDSPQANLQALGRLRELKGYPDVVPEFYYYVCTDLQPHMVYHNRKKDYFDGKVVGHVEINADIHV